MKVEEADICIQIQDQSDWNKIQSHLINQLGYKWENEEYDRKLPDGNGIRDYPCTWRKIVNEYWVFLNKSQKLMATFHSIIPIQSKVVTTQDIITWGDQDRIDIRDSKINLLINIK